MKGLPNDGVEVVGVTEGHADGAVGPFVGDELGAYVCPSWVGRFVGPTDGPVVGTKVVGAGLGAHQKCKNVESDEHR